MNRAGHLGFGLLTLGAFTYATGARYFEGHFWDITLAYLLLSVAPDVDIVLGLKHRGWTHTPAGAVLFGALTSVALNHLLGISYITGFAVGFSATFLHTLLDLTNYMRFCAFYPISRRKVALRLVRSSNPAANILLLLSGAIVFYYALRLQNIPLPGI